ncbi:MAG: SCP2 sterol-binding domain-containing protein [Acidimicrobiales bacterium]
MAYQFLSDEWVAAARKLREEAAATSTPTATVRMNLVITDVPFGEGTMQAHMDTTDGAVELDLGHLESPDVTATLDYATAKAMLVDADPQAGMQAFIAGKIKLQGDLTKAMAMQSGAPNPELTSRIQAITA